jgi:hypothetical protein
MASHTPHVMHLILTSADDDIDLAMPMPMPCGRHAIKGLKHTIHQDAHN